jgi:trehalose/maltose hydrolase-like predicted phosphorylase
MSDDPLVAAFGVASPAVDPAWCLVIEDGPAHLRRVHESLLTVADGHVGTRGTPPEDGEGYQPLVCVAGAYTATDGDDMPRLLPAPLWFRHDLIPGEAPQRWILDLQAGVLYRVQEGDGGIRSLRFASLTRPGTMVQRMEGPAEAVLTTLPDLEPDPRPGAVDTGVTDRVAWLRVHDHAVVTAAVTTAHADDARGRVVDRIAVVGREDERRSVAESVDRAAAAAKFGVDGLLAEHRAAWRQRWDDAAVAIGGDPDLQLAVRFGLFHLMASVADRGEAAVGARGLSGPAYAGHVFWDADVFVLPFLAATHPASARAMLEYRLRRLPAARARAARDGRAGARFPWESADTGQDVTPRTTTGLDGSTIAVRTGELEEHIVADVAWATHQYEAWSGDDVFLAGPGRPLLVDTARYWASRIDVDADGTGHIRGVIGPDEYHGPVDDNAYTNVMARWNLRRAADLCVASASPDVTGGEVGAWRRLADVLVDGYDPATGIYEQFAGFDRLEPLTMVDVAAPPVAADVLLGHDRINQTQIVKQADVLMLHQLVPDQVADGSLTVNLGYYLPRTAHGSSLSPAIHASLLARAGRPDNALDLLRLAARLDLDDRTGMTAAGLHLAAMGGVWQALAFGFAGLATTPDGLRVDPHLPDAWTHLELTVRRHGHRIRLWLGHDTIEIDGDGPIPLLLPTIGPLPAKTSVRVHRTPDGWQEDRP